jgi:colanic acid/amylovoran biosynthesis protein
MVNVLIINTNCSVNKGSAAQVVSMVETLRTLSPSLNFSLLSEVPDLDSEGCERLHVRVISSSDRPFTKTSSVLKLLDLSKRIVQCMLWSGFRKFGLNVKALINGKILQEYARSDLIIDLSGDTLSDKNNYSIFALLGMLTGLLLNKKVAVFSQSIGYFGRTTRPLAKFCLNRACLIVARETETTNYLRKIGINNPHTYLAAEIAFLLKPIPRKRIEEIFLQEGINPNENAAEPLIGLGTNALVYASSGFRDDPYILLMAKIADYLVEELNAQVILLSHVISPQMYDPIDDRYVAHKIHRYARNKNRIKIIEGDYSAEELKGIISEFKLFVGARMHSNIASTSMLVPTVALSWSHKYYGIMKMLGLEEFVCDVETANYEELVSVIRNAWINRESIRRKIASRLVEVEASAFQSTKLIEKLLKPTSPNESTSSYFRK